MGGAVLDLIFPKTCAGCGLGGFPFCQACHELLPWIDASAPRCERCARPSRVRQRACDDCPPEPITWARAPFLFQGVARHAVHRLKFAGDRTVAAGLGSAMADALDLRVDAVTWVPLSRTRRSHRGFDQAKALAAAVARDAGLPLVGLARRVRDAGPQAKRHGAARRWAMEGAFAPARGLGRRSVPTTVALVDDVLTTGSTGASCARALVAAGVRDVGLLVAARSWSHRAPSAPEDEQGDTIER